MIYKIWTFFMVGLLASCADDDAVWKDTGGGSIKLKFTDGLLVSRAADDTPSERAISHLDVFIYKTDGTDPIYERINNPVVTGADNAGTVTLNASLSDFEDRSENVVYVIANAIETITGQETLDELKEKVQEDRRIHVTGTTASGAPQYFLMDGQASSTENGAPGNITINHTSTDDIVMYVTLKRAAAKVVVTLEQGTGLYKFLKDEAQNYEKGYYFRHMPYKTMLLEQTGTNAYPSDYLRIPDKANDNAFEWCKGGENKVVVTAYVYSHQWKDEENEVHTKGTSLVVNIPLWYDTDNDGTVDDGEGVYMNSYYQLPIVNSVEVDGKDTWTIGRNTLYTVTATIEAPGAEDNKQPHTLDNLKYTTEEWMSKRVDVGGGNSPKYLELNKELVEMHNVDTDATLEFVSSSNVNVEVTEVFYNDKFGVKKNENTSIVTVTPDAGLTGSIKIDADVPTNNTIRYITLKVTNQDTGLEETVNVQQYPLLYVTNQLGWYSYRDDFKGTNTNPATPEARGSGITRVGLGSWNTNTKQWSYNYNDDYFWRSKVVRSTYTGPNAEDDEIGRSNIDYYYYYGNELYYSNAQDPGNARMYHVRVTATSFDYTVGIPAKTTDNYTNYEYTDPSEENSKLVSPSFMIASRLGFINTGNGTTLNKADTKEKRLAAFRDHCANYVEVAGDENNRIVYDDWRLPTEAELKIIMDLQGTESQSADAIDYLLNAVYYYSASGPVFNDKNDDNVSTEPGDKDFGTSSWSVRCVRDAYK